MHLSGFTLALFSPVTPDKTDRSVQIIIYFGGGASDLVIKFGPLVKFFVLVDSLGYVILPRIGATTLFFAYFFLSLDDSELLGPSSSSLAIFSLFLTVSL